MKKILLVILCCVVSAGAFSQHLSLQERLNTDKNAKVLNFRPAEKMLSTGNYNYKLSSYNSDDNYINCYYSYDASRRLISVYELIPAEYELIDSIRYNEQNQMVRIDGYQLMGNYWKHVYYLEYTYNNQGLLASRSNYNNFDGVFEIGGTYEYFYNSNGQIISSELTMADMLYQVVEYEYENGLLATETWSYSNPFSSSDVFEPAERMDYSYNNDGNLILLTYNTFDGYSWDLYGETTYTYNEDGNCTEVHSYDANQNETERSIFTFDNRLLEETLMPWTPELTRPQTYNNKNIYRIEEYWALDVNFTLQYVCDYEYNYIDVNAEVGLEDVEANPLTLSPNPTESTLTLSGLEEGVYKMEVMDMSGRIMIMDNITNNSLINLSSLQKGCYVVKVSNNDSIYSSKVIVK